EQVCSGCALYQSKPGDANGPCTAFGGKLVTAGGWCSVFAKKPEPVKP
ncbi:MAG: high-potential iron-sulfur protein, partial [Akkermansiaceae bacterium]|nr:high-potential iron-sulfur protein [Akkermansiaceae bacterium]